MHGNPLGLTPNFDRMAQRGTHFYNTFTCQPVCAPARSCLQTGLYATETGVFRNGLSLADDAVTLADCFNSAGYKTGYIGKWHLAGKLPNGDFQLAVPKERRGGYDYWLGADLTEFASDAYHTALFDGDGNKVELPGYRVDATTDAAIRFVDDQKDNPFFLFLSFLEPHFQNHRDDYPAPDGYEERYRAQWIPPDLAALGGSTHQHLAGYYGMVKRLDEALGRLLDALKSLDLLENTIVLFTTDHGCHFKTRNNEYKRSCHESSVRLPAAACGPGFDGGGRVEGLVSLLDFMPTLLDAAGVEVPEGISGRSVVPSNDTGARDEVLIQISESQVARAIRTNRWKYSVTAPDKDGFEEMGSDTYVEEFLYDVQADPYELTNLIQFESHREVADRLKERLIALMKESGEAEPNIVSAEPRADFMRRKVFPDRPYPGRDW